MAEILEVNRIEQLESCYLVWKSLLEQTPAGSFFQSLEWLTAFWRHFGHRRKLRVLIVSSGGRPVGILPLTVVRERTRRGTKRVLTYPLDDWAGFYGPIGPDPTATLVAAMGHLRRTRRDWDLLDLRWIDRDRLDRGRTATAMRIAGFACHQTVWKRVAIIHLSSGWERYLASRSSRFRAGVRRAVRQVGQWGDVRYERYRPGGACRSDGDPRWDVYDGCVELAARSRQGLARSRRTLPPTSVRAFLRDAHALAAKAGALDWNLLWLNNQLAAFAYNYHRQGRVFGLGMAADPDVSRDHLITALAAHMIQDSFARGDRTFELGPGSTFAQQEWPDCVANSYRCTHDRRSAARAQWLRIKRCVQTRWGPVSSEGKLRASRSRL